MNKVQKGILIDRCIERYCKICKNNGISCEEDKRKGIRDEPPYYGNSWRGKRVHLLETNHVRRYAALFNVPAYHPPRCAELTAQTGPNPVSPYRGER